jgi:hypothetical protein
MCNYKMKNFVIIVISVFFSFSIIAIQHAHPTEELTASDLKSLASVISSKKSEYSTLVIEAFLTPPGYQFKCDVYYRKPDKYALYIFDARDMTPVFIIAQTIAIFYDPLKYCLVSFRNVGVNFVIGMDENDLKFICSFNYREVESKPEINNILEVDLVSILDEVTINTKSETTKGEYAFSGETNEGSRFFAFVNPSSTVPFSKIAIYQKNDTIPLLVLNRIEADGEIADSIFQFPEKRLLGQGLCLIETGVEDLGFVDLLSVVVKTFFIRSALLSSEQRSDLGRLGFGHLDWSEIKKRDKVASRALRKVFSLNDIDDN